MKRLFILLISLTLAINLMAQKFIVTPYGLVNAVDSSKSFIIIKIDGLTSKQLFDNSIRYINKTYKNPSEVIKGKIDNEYLSFTTFVPDFLKIKNGFTDVFFSVGFLTELNFKEGKVKFEIKDLDMHTSKATAAGILPLTFTGGLMDWSVYDKKGSLKRESAKTDIENFFNSEITKLITALNDKDNSNDW